MATTTAAPRPFIGPFQQVRDGVKNADAAISEYNRRMGR
jgi:hypothetical protein